MTFTVDCSPSSLVVLALAFTVYAILKIWGRSQGRTVTFQAKNNR